MAKQEKLAVIIGASSGLAQAVIQERLNDTTCTYRIHGVSSRPPSFQHSNLTWSTLDYEDDQIAQVCDAIVTEYAEQGLNEVMVFNGQLHSNVLSPEKRIGDLESDAFLKLMRANALIPMLFLKHLLPCLSNRKPCKVMALSARVGSIEDNQLGGWYSYRSSKAALNMMLKTFSVELNRKAHPSAIIAYHPGTTDTRLSEPFQRNVPKHALFSREQSAQYLLSVFDQTTIDGEMHYVDWKGEKIDW